MREVTKLLWRDTTPSNDEFPSYVRSIKLIFTRYSTHPVDNVTLDLYCEGATLCKFIHEGRPTTTKRLSLLFESSDDTIRYYTVSPAQKTASTIIEVKINKSLQFQVNWLNSFRDTSIKERPKIHLKIEVLHSFCNPDPTMII